MFKKSILFLFLLISPVLGCMEPEQADNPELIQFLIEAWTNVPVMTPLMLEVQNAYHENWAIHLNQDNDYFIPLEQATVEA